MKKQNRREDLLICIVRKWTLHLSGHYFFKWYSILSFVWIPVLFYTNKSLWVDEFLLALNFQGHGWTHLLHPLDHHQMAPIGFLMACKIFAVLFNNHDFAFKIVPALGWIFSWFFLKKTFEYFKISKIFTWGGLALFSSNVILLSYAYEFKQYSTDTCCSLIIFYLYLISKDRSDFQSWLKFGLVSALCILFSNVAVIVLSALGLMDLLKRGKTFFTSFLFKALLILLFFFALYFLLFLFQHPSEQYMLQYWSGKNAFFPSPNLSVFFWHKVQIILEITFNQKFIGMMFLMLFGFSLFLQRKRNFWGIQNIFFILLFFHLLLSGVKKYPFENRFLLYTIPFGLLSLIYHLNQYKEEGLLNGRKQKFLYALSIFTMIVGISYGSFINVTVATKPKEDLKLAMERLEEISSGIEHIYVSEGAEVGFLYYKHFFSEINSIPYTLAKNTSAESFFAEKKSNLVVLFSHYSPYDNNEQEFENQVRMLGLKSGFNSFQTLNSKRSLVLILNK